jgi:hypothetical protein
MVMYNPKRWFSLIFHAYSRRVMSRLWPALAFMACIPGAIAIFF